MSKHAAPTKGSNLNLMNDTENWRNWSWQLRNRVHDLDSLKAYIDPVKDELDAIEATKGIFRWNITPYYASLMDRHDPRCPIRRQVVPQMTEIQPDIVGVVDPLEEVAHSPVKNLIHNYKDRVAFCVTAECAIYCRYCLRKRMVGDASQFLNKAELQEAIDYIAQHEEIRDVLLTGGDPLTFNEKNLEWIISRLRAIPHVGVIRLGSRLPVTLPYRVTPALCEMLEKYHPIWINTHFNHPRELTADAAAACDRLLRAGVPVGNQTVLLRGINDDVETMKALLEGLVEMRVRPYYLYQAQLIGGTAAFRTSIEKGLEIMESLQGRITGFALPRYILDTPYGKVPLNGSYILGRDGDHVIMRSYSGDLWAEPNPIPEGEATTLHLLKIKTPEGTKTIPTGAETFRAAG